MNINSNQRLITFPPSVTSAKIPVALFNTTASTFARVALTGFLFLLTGWSHISTVAMTFITGVGKLAVSKHTWF